MDMAALLSELDDHGFDSTSTARKVARINAAYWDICSREPWPFLDTLVRLQFTSGTSYEPDTPITNLRAVTSMKLEAAVGQAWGGREVSWVREDDYELALGNNTVIATGDPRIFYIDGQNALHFWPAPSAAQIVRCRYLKRPAALTSTSAESDIVIPFEFHDVLRDGALFKLYAMEDDTDIAPTFENYYERGLQNMREQVWKTQYTRPEFIHPTSLDDLGIDSWGWGAYVSGN